MTLIAEKNGFKIYFNCTTQAYSVYKDGWFVIGMKFKYSDVKSYVQ